MSRFNTGNPLGSNDPRDLDDNAKNMDLAVNSDAPQWVDRLARNRKTFAGMESEFQSAQEIRETRFNDFIVSSGYQFIGDYGPGLEITEYNQLIRDADGEFWRVSGQVDLPYVTTGAGIPEDAALVPAGDAVLRQELSDPDMGAAMVAYAGPDGAEYSLADLADPDKGAALVAFGGDNVKGALELRPPMYAGFDALEYDGSSLVTVNSDIFSVQESIVNGGIATPDCVPIGGGKYAVMHERGAAKRVGVFKSNPRLRHRVGDFLYEKFSPTKARLLTDLSHYLPNTRTDLPGTIVGYVDFSRPNNSGDGLTWETAKRDLYSAIGMGADIILIRAGHYHRGMRIQDFTVTKDLALIAVGGPVVCGSIATGDWASSSYAEVYKLTYSSGLTNETNAIFDTGVLNDQFAPTAYTKVSSIAEVATTPGSFWHDVADRITYVRAIDSRDLTLTGHQLRLLQPVPGPVITYAGDYKVLFDGIQLWGGHGGGSDCLRIKSNGIKHLGSVFYNRDCSFNGSTDGGGGNGLAVRDIGVCISERSRCVANRRDGFNYHNGEANNGGGTDLAPHFVEIDCHAHGNGAGGAENNNQGSTSHEDCVGFRINGDYSGHADGGCVVDIDATRAFMVAIKAKDSSIVGMGLSCDNYKSLGNYGEWWIDGAYCSGNPPVANNRGDIAMDGYWSKIHMVDCVTEKPVSTRSFSALCDDDMDS